MRSLAYHEAVPGHHFQLAIQQELVGLPKVRTQRIFGGGSAHSEGWALYTERLAVEQAVPMGWHRYVGPQGAILGMTTFGASAPLKDVAKRFNFTAEKVLAAAKALL